MSTDPWVWLSALLMLALYSFLYKENPVFRLVEHFYVGSGAGYMLAVGFRSIKNTGWVPLTEKGQISLLIPLVLGILLYSRYVPKVAWLGRLGLSVSVGLGAGISMRAIPSAQIIGQIRATVGPLNSLDSILMLVGVIGTICYFLFTTRRNAVVSGLASIGKWTLMITFGLTFATMVFGQASIYLGALQTLLGTWLGLIK